MSRLRRIALALLIGLALAASLAHTAAHQQTPPTSGALRRLTIDGQSLPLAWTADACALLLSRPGRVLAAQHLSELWSVPAAGDARGNSARRLSENAFYVALKGDQIAYLRYLAPGRWELARTSLDTAQAGPVAPPVRADRRLPPRWVGDDLLFLDALGQIRTSAGAGPWRSFGDLAPDIARASLSPGGELLAYTDPDALRVVRGRAPGDRSPGDGPQIVYNLGAGTLVGHMSWSPAGRQLAYVRLDGSPDAQLWVWDADADRQWMAHSVPHGYIASPTWSPDGASLAFSAYPAGSGPAAGGDLWVVRADGSGAHVLAATPADESHPIWSPDGRWLAFAMEGDVWIADLTAHDLDKALPAAAQAAWSPPALDDAEPSAAPASLVLSAPITIRVKHDDAGNTCRDRPEGAVDVYPFEDYVKRVVPFEVYVSWPAETLKAQAVAARTYAWKKILQQRSTFPDPGYDVWDSTRDQYMCDATYPSTDHAVDETTGQYISYAGKVIYAFFCAEAGSPTNYRQELNLEAAPYLRPVDDPVGFGETRRGHSWGMSQWGAYRWAAWHGWDYVQILTHYYSFSTVAPSYPAAGPIAALSRPWPGSYVTADQAYVAVNAGAAIGPGSAVDAITVSAQVTGAWTLACADADGADGWGCVWPLGALADTDQPSIALRATVVDAAGAPADSRVSWIGLHRTPPTGKLGIEHTPVHTVNVALDLYAHDPEPIVGPLCVGLGGEDWVWEDHALSHLGGQVISDTGAEDGSAWYVGAGGGVLYGPYTTRLPSPAPYRALFRIKAPAAALTTPHQIAKLDVAADEGGVLLGVRYLHGADLGVGDAYAEYAVDFWHTQAGVAIEFRVDASGIADLWVDRVRVITYPTVVPPTVTWTLPAREGTSTVTAKFVDAAGNHSADVTLPIELVDNTPPEQWRRVACSAAACTVEVRDAIAGLDVDSAAYRFSFDGGSSWPTGWLPAGCTGVDSSQQWETVSAPPLPAGANLSDLRIQFQIADAAAAPNVAYSPVYTIWHTFLPLIRGGSP